MLAVNLAESQIAWEMGLWACLWRIILIVLAEVVKPAHCGWPYSLARSLDCISRERHLGQCVCLSTPICFLAVDVMFEQLLQAPALHFSVTVDYILGMQARINSFFLQLLLSLKYFLTMAVNKTEETQCKPV